VGAITLQGPHQAAQKSTSTGTGDFSTSCSKFASVTAAAFAMATPPSSPLRSELRGMLMSWGTNSMQLESRLGGKHRVLVKQASTPRALRALTMSG
jgi:hypothetical protein